MSKDTFDVARVAREMGKDWDKVRLLLTETATNTAANRKKMVEEMTKQVPSILDDMQKTRNQLIQQGEQLALSLADMQKALTKALSEALSDMRKSDDGDKM